jgi:hypothetical protein
LRLTELRHEFLGDLWAVPQSNVSQGRHRGHAPHNAGCHNLCALPSARGSQSKPVAIILRACLPSNASRAYSFA